jgi:Periplasmic pectate lyase.
MYRRHFLGGALAAPLLAARPAKEGPYQAGARQFLDTMIEKGTDRYGSKSPPIFCLSLDPETYTPPKAPERVDWKYRRDFEHLYRDFGYYWKSHLHSSNLIYDQTTIRALYELTKVSGAPKYARAADQYLDFFLNNLISPQTGIFGWGEHVFYNVFTDYIIGGAFSVRSVNHFAYNHELDRWTTIYDLTWPKSPDKTLAEIDAIFDYKIHDPVTFLNNRHSDFYSGRVTSDTSDVH